MSISASKILVPIGFSEQSMIALGQAFNLAKIKKSEVVFKKIERILIKLYYRKQSKKLKSFFR